MQSFCLFLFALFAFAWAQDLDAAIGMESELEADLDQFEESPHEAYDEIHEDEASMAKNCTQARKQCIGHHAGSTCTVAQNRFNCLKRIKCLAKRDISACNIFKELCPKLSCKVHPRPPMKTCNATKWGVCASMGMNTTMGACGGLQNNMTCARKAHCFSASVAAACRSFKMKYHCMNVSCSMPSMKGCGRIMNETDCDMQMGCQWNAMTGKCMKKRMQPQCSTKSSLASCASTKGCVWNPATATCGKKSPNMRGCSAHMTAASCDANMNCQWSNTTDSCQKKSMKRGCSTHMTATSCDANMHCQWSNTTDSCVKKMKPTGTCSNKEYSNIDICVRGKLAGKPSWQVPVCESIAAKVECAKAQSAACAEQYMSICKLEMSDCPKLQCTV